MKNSVFAGLIAVGLMMPAGAAWKGLVPENHVCGPKLSEQTLKGKVVLVDKWATWCGPCRAMMPHTEQIAKKFKGRPLVVIGSHVSRGFSQPRVEAYVKENGFSFSFYRDVEWDADVGYDGGIPFLYVIDKKGNVVYGGRNPKAVEKAIADAVGKAGGATFLEDGELVRYAALKGRLVPGKPVEEIVRRLKADIALANKNPASVLATRKKPEAEKIVACVEEYKTDLLGAIEAEIAEGDATSAIGHIDLLIKTWPSLKKTWAAKRKELQAKAKDPS